MYSAAYAYNTILCIVEIYLTTMLIIGLVKAAKIPRRGKRQTYKFWLLITISIGAFVSVCDSVLYYLLLVAGDFLPHLCDGIINAKCITVSLSLGCTYTMMWLRQRTLYLDSAIERWGPRHAKKFSTAVGIILVVLVVFNAALFIATQKHEGVDTLGCILVSSVIPNWVAFIILGTISATMESILLFLFIYPLLKYMKSSTLERQNLNYIPQVTLRAFFTTLVCVLSDVAASASSIILIHEHRVATASIGLQISILINVISCIASFKKWKILILRFNNVSPTDENMETTERNGN
uniref:uncharacterized protein LOC120328205 n=1 Tax=Styela clava TaxID=7725 RepID=UPI00193A71EF|nr:uncharacterized protein LOC120328205 [Styela clava]